MSQKLYIALGSNIGEREQTILKALDHIDKEIGQLIKKSTLIESEPLFIPEHPELIQPPYLNGVALFSSSLEPNEILNKLLKIEERLGRKRDEDTIRWGPRTIDLDIVAIDNTIRDSKALTLPHPELQNRNFVLEPLKEISPDWTHPKTHETIDDLIKKLPH